MRFLESTLMLRTTVLSGLIILTLAGCVGGREGSLTSINPDVQQPGLEEAVEANLQVPDQSSPLAVSIEESLARLDAQPTPDGVDETLFADLKAVLREALLARGVAEGGQSKITASPPTGSLNQIDDAWIFYKDDGTYELQWTYRNQGDYDQNGEVNVSDITPIARYFNSYLFGEQWNEAKVADGDSNGVVTISDITPIAINLLSSVNHYLIEKSADGESGWTVVETVSLADGFNLTDDGLLRFSFPLQDASPGDYFRISPIHANLAGTSSLVVEIDGSEPQAVLNDYVRVFEGKQTSSITFSIDGTTATLPRDEAMGIVPGQVLLIPDDTGGAYYVTDVHATQAEIVLDIRAASLEEVFERLNLAVDLSDEDGDWAFETVAGATIEEIPPIETLKSSSASFDYSFNKRLSLDVSSEFQGAEITANGYVDIRGNFPLQITIGPDWTNLSQSTEFYFNPSLSLDAPLEVELFGPIPDVVIWQFFNASRTVWVNPGGFPLKLKFEMPINAVVDSDVGISFDAHISAATRVDISYTPESSLQWLIPPGYPQFFASADFADSWAPTSRFEFSLQAKPGMYVYGLAGPYLDIKAPYIAYDATYNPHTEQGHAVITAGGRAQLKGKLQIVKWKVIDFGLIDLFDTVFYSYPYDFPDAPPVLQPPGSLNATDGTYTDKVRVTWNHPTSGDTPDGYRVYRDGSLIGSVLYPDLQYYDTTSAPGTTYAYKAKSYKSGTNDSGYSNVDNGSRGVVPVAPNPPTNPIISVGATEYPNAINIYWVAPTSGPSPVSYTIRRRCVTGNDPNGSRTYRNCNLGPADVSNYGSVDNNVLPGISYKYKYEIASYANGLYSDYVEAPQEGWAYDPTSTYTASGHVKTSGGTPIIGVTVSITGDGTASDNTDNNGDWSVSLNDGDYTATPAKSGWTFAPINQDFYISGNDYQLPQDFIGVEGLNPPGNLNATDDTYTDKVRVTWNHPGSGATPDGYKIYRATSETGSYSLQTTTSYTTTWDDTNATPGTTYWYKARSYKSGSSDSGYSNTNSGRRAPESWKRTWGGSSDERIWGVATDDTNVYLAGYTESFGAGAKDVVVVKYSVSGTLLWKKTWGGSSDDVGNSIAVDTSGNVYVGGYTTSFPSGNEQALLLKYNSSGTVQYAKTWGGANFDAATGVGVNGIYVYLSGVTESYGNGSTGSGDLFLLKHYASSGNNAWQSTWGSTSPEDSLPHKVAFDSGGSPYICGYTGHATDGNGTDNDALLIKFNSSDGTVAWSRKWGGSSLDRAEDILITDDNYVYMAGYSVSYGYGDRDALLVKLNTSGSYYWNKTWGTSYTELGRGLAEDSSGNIILGGSQNLSSGSNYEATILSFTPSGSLNWAKQWGGSNIYDFGNCMCSDSNGNLFLAGNSNSYSGNWQSASGSVSNGGSTSSATGTRYGHGYSIGSPNGSTSSPGGNENGAGGGDLLLLKNYD